MANQNVLDTSESFLGPSLLVQQHNSTSTRGWPTQTPLLVLRNPTPFIWHPSGAIGLFHSADFLWENGMIQNYT